MHYILYELKNYTEEEYERDWKAVSGQRRQTALQYVFAEDRKRSIKAYRLLQECIRAEFDLALTPEFSFGPYGKPYIKDHPEIFFSMSHCASAALCAVHRAPVGADVENNIEPQKELLEMACSPAEIRRILSSPDPENAFAACWTRKESVSKLTGTGLAGIHDPRELPCRGGGRYTFLTEAMPQKKLALSVCSYAEPQDGSLDNRIK